MSFGIIIKGKGESFYGPRHSKRIRSEDRAKYRLRIGMAKVALRTKVSGKEKCDARGTPLLYSNRMADGHSIRTIERWAKGKGPTTYFFPGSSSAKRG